MLFLFFLNSNACNNQWELELVYGYVENELGLVNLVIEMCGCDLSAFARIWIKHYNWLGF